MSYAGGLLTLAEKSSAELRRFDFVGVEFFPAGRGNGRHRHSRRMTSISVPPVSITTPSPVRVSPRVEGVGPRDVSLLSKRKRANPRFPGKIWNDHGHVCRQRLSNSSTSFGSIATFASRFEARGSSRKRSMVACPI